MGAECSVDRMNNIDEDKKEEKIKKEQKQEVITSIQNFEFKSYKEYTIKMEIFTKRVQEIMKITEMLNNFHLPKSKEKIYQKIENSYYSSINLVKMEKLYEVKFKVITYRLLC